MVILKIMEEELNYVTVTFKPKEKQNDLEGIYEEMMTKEQAKDTNPVKQENKKKAPQYSLLHLLAAGLGIICVILVSVVIILSIHLKTVRSEHRSENINLTTQNLLLRKEMTDLKRKREELTRERDGLNWTISVILEYENFPVHSHCPQKVCTPCLDGWVPFQSNCYMFFQSDYYYSWKTWQGSRDYCREMTADLVVIESQEEQEFISSHIKSYDDERHGYWIGLSKEVMDTWTWVDGSNFTVRFWKTQQPGYRVSCALSLPEVDPQANWYKASCDMRNRWICETSALIKPVSLLQYHCLTLSGKNVSLCKLGSCSVGERGNSCFVLYGVLHHCQILFSHTLQTSVSLKTCSHSLHWNSMEEELNYATVVFKDGGGPPKEKNEDSTVYSAVKSKGLATTEPTDGKAAACSQHFHLLPVCLGLLSALLVASISAIIYISVAMNEQKADFRANLRNLTTENQQLIMERSILENNTEEISRARDDLNWTLSFIMKFNTFPVNEYCPTKKCQPCQKGWILFQEKCYLFYNNNPWKTWQESQKYCKDTAADLVVIDSLQEQEFLSNHTEYYYDKYHGYWLGLHQSADENWLWTDGRNDTLGYWMRETLGDIGKCALMIPRLHSTSNWDPADCKMRNKFICEREVLIRSNY
ncbi:uncharacterized protein LOC121185526 [Toxotes jaculatrix]|uniref:uncharacterized protein LOC121185526 n=1 Tax=Toxotes jaculatrix TaxID=941984 RepID=UPI001B3B0699|nr:uncharacterized protein LOC121185526 [Toxotes jaculatrix]